MRTFVRNILCFLGCQRWIRLGIRYRLILKQPYEQIKFSVSFFGLHYVGMLDEYIDRHVFYFGAYEREELALVTNYLSVEKLVLDIGANSGHHSLFFSRYSKEVHSFEPYTKVLDKMRERITENGVSNIFVYPFGLGLKDEELSFSVPFSENEGGGSFVREEGEVKIALPVREGKTAVKDIGDTGFIKIDVEGMELEVLKSIESVIELYKPVLFVEMSAQSQKKFTISSGYTVYIVEANRPFLFFFNIPGGRLLPWTPQQRTENLLCVPLSS